MRVSTSWRGLIDVVPDPERAKWKDHSWKGWEHLTLCQDRGSDGVCATNALLSCPEVKANVTCWFDERHDWENDLYNICRGHGLYPCMIVMCVVMNLGHGCERDRGQRYWQFVDLLRVIFENFKAASGESFQLRSSAMLDDLADTVPSDDDKPASESLWAFEKARSGRPNLGERVNMVRFLSWPAAGRDLLREWSSLLWKVELLCIECDWLSGAQFKANLSLRVQQLVAEEQARGSTSANLHCRQGRSPSLPERLRCRAGASRGGLAQAAHGVDGAPLRPGLGLQRDAYEGMPRQ